MTVFVLGLAGVFTGAIVGLNIAAHIIRRIDENRKNGAYGEVEMWKAQLAEERPVILSTYQTLPRDDQIRISSVAESRAEFVDLTMSEANEYLEGTEFEGITANELEKL